MNYNNVWVLPFLKAHMMHQLQTACEQWINWQIDLGLNSCFHERWILWHTKNVSSTAKLLPCELFQLSQVVITKWDNKMIKLISDPIRLDDVQSKENKTKVGKIFG